MDGVFAHIDLAIAYCFDQLKKYGRLIETESWQGIKKEVPMWEVENVRFRSVMPWYGNATQTLIKPDLPWAEDHFKERISGKPLNPGEQYLNWPGYKNREFNDRNFKKDEKFSHTYMERYWPKEAGDGHYETTAVNDGGQRLNMMPIWKGYNEKPLKGIRFPYGDLNDVIELLRNEPHTRQAYLPVWFPEDTGVVHGGRVPCTIGYHFIIRDGHLNCHYLIRACDAIRHFRNDVYLTIRLVQFIADEIAGSVGYRKPLMPGILTMEIINFHVFASEKNLI